MIDTNAYADFMRGKAWQVAFSEGLELFLPLMAVAELRAGFRAGTQGKQNIRNLLVFIAADRVKVVARFVAHGSVVGISFAVIHSLASWALSDAG